MLSADSILSQQFPAIDHNLSLLKKPLLAFFRYLFHEREFQAFAQKYPHLYGFDFIDQVLDYFDFSYTVSNREKERIPPRGRVVIVANHPIGSLDGLALLKLVGEVRRDVKAVANDLLLTLEPMQNLLLPVDAFNGKTGKENLRAIEKHLENDGAIIIFPAGEVSRFSPGGIKDGQWRGGFLRFANKTKSPVLPIHIDAKNSIFFYTLSLLARPLSTLWLIREMFKQSNNCIRLRIGRIIEPLAWKNLPIDDKARVKLFKRHVYELPRNRDKNNFGLLPETIAHPEDRQLLRKEIRQCEVLGQTADAKQIFCYRYTGDSSLMREIGRLREVSFRAVGEGTGKRRDIDAFDSYYDHIVLWDDEALEIVGAYRLLRLSQVSYCTEALYSSSLFIYNTHAQKYLSQGLELGRSFVQPHYWGKRALDYLWYGIGAYINHHPEIRYLFGPVSISNAYSAEAKDLLIKFYGEHFAPDVFWAQPRNPYCFKNDEVFFSDESYLADFTRLKSQLDELGYNVPTLYKQYSELCEVGGVQFVGFNIDAEFSDCIDGLVLVDLEKLKPGKKARYLG